MNIKKVMNVCVELSRIMTRLQFFGKRSFSFMVDVHKLSVILMTALLTGYFELPPNGSQFYSVALIKQMEKKITCRIRKSCLMIIVMSFDINNLLTQSKEKKGKLLLNNELPVCILSRTEKD